MQFIIGSGIATLIGTNVLNNVVSGTIGVLYTSATFIKNGTEISKIIIHIRQQIEVLDIPLKLELVNSLMNTDHENKINIIIENGLNELTLKIKTLLGVIDNEIIYHQTKWFSGYRSIYIDEKIYELENLMKVLDGRIKLLMNK
jgi:hypothetical protein